MDQKVFSFDKYYPTSKCVKNEAEIPLKTFLKFSEEVKIRWQWSDCAHMTR